MALRFDKDTEKAIYVSMREFPLEPGQALWFGPRSVKILAEPGAFRGKLPDKLVLEESEWRAKPTVWRKVKPRKK
jgi:hypothetical protein